MIEHVAKQIDKKYSDVILSELGKKTISLAVKRNPRELKRFINNFIVSFEIFSPNPKVDLEQLLLVQALKSRPEWGDFYRNYSTSSSYRDNVKQLLKIKYTASSIEKLQKLKKEERGVTDNMLLSLGSDLYGILSSAQDTLMSINDWEVYRRAVETTEESPSIKG